MSEASDIGHVLDPMERISDTLFGLTMALTFICSLGIATAGNIRIQTLLIGALGCNLAWGIVDGGLFLLARINGRDPISLRCVQYGRRRILKPRDASLPTRYRRNWRRSCLRSNWS